MHKFKVFTLVELCQQLTESERSKVYIILTRLIHLVLIWSVSTTTTEQTFLVIKHMKKTLCNKMKDDFLVDYLILYIEWDFVKNINVDYIIDKFYASKN